MTQAIQKSEAKQSPVDAMLVGMMNAMQARAVRLENLLPPDMPVARFMESIRLALALNPDLANKDKCDPASVVLAVMEAARAGLDVHGHYGHLVKYGRECQFIPDYKGLVALAVTLGVARDMTPILVYDRDDFWVEEGETPHVHHRPFVPKKTGDKRGEIIAAYTRVTYPDGARVVKGLLYMDDIARVEANTPRGGPWGGPHRPEMVKKTSVKNAWKTLGAPASEQAERMRVAMDADNRASAVEAQWTPVASLTNDTPTSGVAGAKAAASKALKASSAFFEPSEAEKAAILEQERAMAEPGSEG